MIPQTGRAVEPFERAVAPVEGDRDGLSGERRRDHRKCHDRGHERGRAIDAERAERQQRHADQQRDRDEHRQQQLLTVAQQELELEPKLRGQHALHGRGSGVG
jgi:hypothetical protein